jgi:PqqD family protein of HPr-rel-A system
MRSPGRIDPPGRAGEPGPAGAVGANTARTAARAGGHPRRRPDVAWAEIDGEVVIYDPERTTSHLLNPSAAAIWISLDGRTSLAEIAADLAETFGVDPTSILADVVSAATALDRQGLIAP